MPAHVCWGQLSPFLPPGGRESTQRKAGTGELAHSAFPPLMHPYHMRQGWVKSFAAAEGVRTVHGSSLTKVRESQADAAKNKATWVSNAAWWHF